MRIITHPNTFKDGARVIYCTSRNKDGSAGNKTIGSMFSRSPEEFDKVVAELIEKASGEPFRVYSTVEARDVQKAIRLFKERQLAADYRTNPEDFYFNSKSRWLSALANPKNAVEKFWLFDCDTPKETEATKRMLAEDYTREFTPYEYKTKNGVHIVTQPFHLTAEGFDGIVQKNASLLVAYS